jgi:hypothetical protein
MSDNFGFGNQNIEINSVPKNSNKNNISNPRIDNSNVIPMNNQNKDDNLIENKKEREVVVINPYKDKFQTSLEAINKTWIDKFFCCFAIFKKYFQITSQDFLLRFLNSLIPFNNKFQNLVKDKPDLYGPIWIYSSLIIIISATGSLTRTLQGNNNKNFFQEFVPIAGVVIYGVGFGLPILIAFLMKIFGTSLTFASVICTYGYSFSIFLPISIICVIQWDILQWISLIYAIFSSTSLLVVNYYKQMGDYSKNKKFLIIIIVLIFQFGLLLFFKLYFFQRFSQEVMSENNENINNGTILYNNTNEMTNIINEAINYNNTNIAKNNSDAITNNSFDLGSNI